MYTTHERINGTIGIVDEAGRTVADVWDWPDAAQIAAALAGNAAHLAEQLLLALTPGGSEFHGSPERCAEWARDRMAGAGKLALERNKAQNELARVTAGAEPQRLAAERLAGALDWAFHTGRFLVANTPEHTEGWENVKAALAAWQEAAQ